MSQAGNKLLIISNQDIHSSHFDFFLNQYGDILFKRVSDFSEIAPAAFVTLYRPDWVLVHINTNEGLLPTQLIRSLVMGLTGTESKLMFMDTVHSSCTHASPLSAHEFESCLQSYNHSISLTLGRSTKFVHEFLKSVVGRTRMTIDFGDSVPLLNDKLKYQVLLRLLRHFDGEDGFYKSYCLAASGYPSYAEVCSYILETAARISPQLKLPALSIRSNAQQFHRIDLDSGELQYDLGFILPDWQDLITEEVSACLFNDF